MLDKYGDVGPPKYPELTIKPKSTTKRMATAQQSKVKVEKMMEAEVKAEQLGVKAEVEEEMKAEAETIKETEVDRRWIQR